MAASALTPSVVVTAAHPCNQGRCQKWQLAGAARRVDVAAARRQSNRLSSVQQTYKQPKRKHRQPTCPSAAG